MTRPKKADLLAALGGDLSPWRHQCHAASAALIKSGACGPDARLARGTCMGVGGQHSWVVLGRDVYDQSLQVVDATLWSYDADVVGLYVGKPTGHRPHGTGLIWHTGKPVHGGGTTITLPGTFSARAQAFLDALGPLDQHGWLQLANGPMQNWPAAEIVDRMCDVPQLEPLVPVDVVGMLTDRNPGGHYLFTKEVS